MQRSARRGILPGVSYVQSVDIWNGFPKSQVRELHFLHSSNNCIEHHGETHDHG
jgi:hypothetical protein